MAVRYVVFDNELVSVEWATVLHDMRADGVYFHINEGHRTIARQTYFWNCYLSKRCNNGNLAARPTPWAPHIRTGRIDHAIDFDNAAAVIAWLNAHGIPASLTVPGESWHVEVRSANDLRDYHRKHTHDIYDTLPKHVEVAVRRLFMHRNMAIDEAKTGKGPKYRKAVKWRGHWRRVIQAMLARARKERTRRILRQVLEHN